MLFLAADFHKVVALADDVGHAGFFIQLGAELVKVGHFQLAAALDAAAVGFQLAQNQFQQGSFAGAVGADQADFVAAQNAAGKVLDQRAAFKAFADVFQLGHQLAGALAGVQLEVDLAYALAAGGALAADFFQAAHAAFVAGAACFHAFADPHFFLGVEFIKDAVLFFFHGQLFGFAYLVGAKAAGVAAQQAAVQLDDAGGDVVQKAAVVGDQQHAAGKVLDQAFQPLDGAHVQVVGGFVQQQHVGAGRQRTRQGDALFPAAG